MKEKLTNNLGLKILSVLLAFFVWLLVVNVSNPEVSRSQDVAIEFLNESVLLDAGEAYEVNRRTVTVDYDVHTLDESRIKASDFRATADLSELYDVTGSVQITVEVLNNANLMRNVTPRPGVVHVTTEEMQSKEFELTVNITGRPMDNYSVNTVRLDPGTITVTGPVSQVGLINSVGVEINVMRSGDDISGTASPVFYDANGNELPASSTNRITVDNDQINYYIGIDRDREIPLIFEITGTPADGCRYAGYEADTESVRVSGTEDVLASLESITVSSSSLSLEGATSDRVIRVDISPFLPPGVYLTDPNQTMVEVHLMVEQLITETIHLSESEVTVTGMETDLDYRIPSPAVTLVVRGVESELATLRVEDYGVTLDVSGLGEGTHSVQPAYVQDDPRFTVTGADPVMIDIIRRNIGPGMPQENREPTETREDTAREPVSEDEEQATASEDAGEEETAAETEDEAEEEAEEEDHLIRAGVTGESEGETEESAQTEE